MKTALAACVLLACVLVQAYAHAHATEEDDAWPSEARSPEALCAWFRAHDMGEAVPATCRVVCRASRGPMRAAVLHRGSGFHEGLAIAIRDGARARYRIVHDDVDDEDGVIIQGGMSGSLSVQRCTIDASSTLDVTVERYRTGEPPHACDVTRDTTRLTCRRADAHFACTRSSVHVPVTTTQTPLECGP